MRSVGPADGSQSHAPDAGKQPATFEVTESSTQVIDMPSAPHLHHPRFPPAFIPKDRVPKRTAAPVGTLAGNAALPGSRYAPRTRASTPRRSARQSPLGVFLRLHPHPGGPMVFSLLSRWQRKGARFGDGTSNRRPCRPTYRPRFEALEDRCVLSTRRRDHLNSDADH